MSKKSTLIYTSKRKNSCYIKKGSKNINLHKNNLVLGVLFRTPSSIVPYYVAKSASIDD